MLNKEKMSKLINNNSTMDPNKILPMKYMWAREHYKSGIANNWVPEEIPMQLDIEQWKKPGFLSESERRLILWNLGFFATAESLTANNLVLAVYKHVTNPECRQYLLRQAYEEAVHTDTFIYCCDSLGLDPEYIYTMYQNIPSIKNKDDFIIGLTKSIFNPNFSTENDDNIRLFIHDLIGYYVIMEGIFFYAGFAMMLALKRANKMVGIGQQFEYIMRDESIHLAFGCDLINNIIAENPQVLNDQFKDEIIELIKKAVLLEQAYAYDTCKDGLLGMNAKQFCDYVEYIADRRLERLGLNKIYNKQNPFLWLSEVTDLRKKKNFFETKVTEYQTGTLTW
jgi:ribonucleoside-diphosphate reductase beta chain